jgi:hypothetical protein
MFPILVSGTLLNAAAGKPSARLILAEDIGYGDATCCKAELKFLMLNIVRHRRATGYDSRAFAVHGLHPEAPLLVDGSDVGGLMLLFRRGPAARDFSGTHFLKFFRQMARVFGNSRRPPNAEPRRSTPRNVPPPVCGA